MHKAKELPRGRTAGVSELLMWAGGRVTPLLDKAETRSCPERTQTFIETTQSLSCQQNTNSYTGEIKPTMNWKSMGGVDKASTVAQWVKGLLLCLVKRELECRP